MNKEIWKPILNNHYEASSTGKVRRLKPSNSTVVGRELKPFILNGMRGNYLAVRTSINGKNSTATLHKLITLAFFGKRPNGLEVNHKDLNKMNNNISNLEYITRIENIKHAVVNGAYRVRDEKRRMKK